MEISNYINKVKIYNQYVNNIEPGDSYYMANSAKGDLSTKKSIYLYEGQNDKKTSSARESMMPTAHTAMHTRSYIGPQTNGNSPESHANQEVTMIVKEKVIEIPVYSDRSAQDRDLIGHLYSTVGLLVLEIKRLHWKAKTFKPDSKVSSMAHSQVLERNVEPSSNNSGSPLKQRYQDDDIMITKSQHLPEAHFKFLFEDLQVKFDSLLAKNNEAREENEKRTLEIERLNSFIKAQALEIEHLASEQQKVGTASFVETSNLIGKYKVLQEQNVRQENNIFALENQIEDFKQVKSELNMANALFSEKAELAEKLRAEVQISVDDANLFKALIQGREKEIDKLNTKIAELVKVAQEYTHIKQLLDIARRDVEAYKEAYDSREKLVSKLNTELGKLDVLSQALQASSSRQEFLEGEVSRLTDRISEQDRQIEGARSKAVEQELERFKNNELSKEVSQLAAKLEYVDKKLLLKEEENDGLRGKLEEALAKVEELRTCEIKLDQVGAEREELLAKVYELKKELVEANKMVKVIEDLEKQGEEKEAKLEEIARKLEKTRGDCSQLKVQNDQLKTEVLELELKQKDFGEVKSCLGETQDLLRAANDENDKLEETVRHLDKVNNEKQAEITKLRNDFKEENEKQKSKLIHLSADNQMMEEKLKQKADVEKQLERSQIMHSDLKNSYDNLVQRAMNQEKEIGGLQMTLDKEKKVSDTLQAKVNELKEVETKNKDLHKNIESISKNLVEVIEQKKELQHENQKAKDKIHVSQIENEQLKEELVKKVEEVKQVEDKIEEIKEQDTAVVVALEQEIDNMKEVYHVATEEIENWRKKFEDLRLQFDKYIQEYEKMSMKFDRMSAINEDHVKDIENKAFAISQLHRRLLIQMIELHRIDSVRNEAQ